MESAALGACAPCGLSAADLSSYERRYCPPTRSTTRILSRWRSRSRLSIFGGGLRSWWIRSFRARSAFAPVPPPPRRRHRKAGTRGAATALREHSGRRARWLASATARRTGSCCARSPSPTVRSTRSRTWMATPRRGAIASGCNGVRVQILQTCPESQHQASFGWDDHDRRWARYCRKSTATMRMRQRPAVTSVCLWAYAPVSPRPCSLHIRRLPSSCCRW
jgi:hypothetical protein